MASRSLPLFVLAGGPGVGKTSVLDALRAEGFRCVPDAARELIRERLGAGLSPRPAPEVFARNIFELDSTRYREAGAEQGAVFFERGVVDAAGALVREGAISDAELAAYLEEYPYYERVFLFPPWQAIYRTDSERDQSYEESVAVFEAVRRWYARCGYGFWEVPLGSVTERVEFIEARIAGVIA